MPLLQVYPIPFNDSSYQMFLDCKCILQSRRTSDRVYQNTCSHKVHEQPVFKYFVQTVRQENWHVSNQTSSDAFKHQILNSNKTCCPTYANLNAHTGTCNTELWDSASASFANFFLNTAIGIGPISTHGKYKLNAQKNSSNMSP